MDDAQCPRRKGLGVFVLARGGCPQYARGSDRIGIDRRQSVGAVCTAQSHSQVGRSALKSIFASCFLLFELFDSGALIPFDPLYQCHH